MVTLQHSICFLVVYSFISCLHSTGHLMNNQPPVQPKDMELMGHSGQGMSSAKVVMAWQVCSPLSSCQYRGCLQQVYWEHLQDCRYTIQLIGQQDSASLLYLDILSAPLKHPPFISLQKDSSHEWNLWKEVMLGLWIYTHCWMISTTIRMQIMIMTIHQFWAV